MGQKVLRCVRTLAIELPMGIDDPTVNAVIANNLGLCGVKYAFFDAFRIPSRINVLDAYRIILYDYEQLEG